MRYRFGDYLPDERNPWKANQYPELFSLARDAHYGLLSDWSLTSMQEALEPLLQLLLDYPIISDLSDDVERLGRETEEAARNADQALHLAEDMLERLRRCEKDIIRIFDDRLSDHEDRLNFLEIVVPNRFKPKLLDESDTIDEG